MNDIFVTLFHVYTRGPSEQTGAKNLAYFCVARTKTLKHKHNEPAVRKMYELNLYSVHRRLNSYVSNYSPVGWSIQRGGHLYCIIAVAGLACTLLSCVGL